MFSTATCMLGTKIGSCGNLMNMNRATAPYMFPQDMSTEVNRSFKSATKESYRASAGKEEAFHGTPSFNGKRVIGLNQNDTSTDMLNYQKILFDTLEDDKDGASARNNATNLMMTSSQHNHKPKIGNLGGGPKIGTKAVSIQKRQNLGGLRSTFGGE